MMDDVKLLGADGGGGGGGGGGGVDWVVASAVFVFLEFPAALKDNTRYRYVVCAVRPRSAKLVTLALTLEISEKFEQPPPAHRSIANPVSLSELSFQPISIWLEEIAVAVRLAGAFGFAPLPPPAPPRPCAARSVIDRLGNTDRTRGSFCSLASPAASGSSTDAAFRALKARLTRAPLIRISATLSDAVVLPRNVTR